jgi:uncharacterized protein (DUF433 family)
VSDRPQVCWSPGMRFGEPHVRGRPVDAIGGMVWAGERVEVVAEEYDVTREEVIVACWWLGRHGEPRWRRRWKAWTQVVESELWHGRYDVQDPPDREET